MKPTHLHQPERLALRRASDELVRKWWELPTIDPKAAEDFRGARNALIAAVKDILALEGLLGPEESELLDWASTAPDYLHTLAMRKIIKALNISEERVDAPSGCRTTEC